VTDAAIELAAVIIDCADPRPVAQFYVEAAGGEVVRDDPDGVWIRFSGNNVIFRQVAGYRPPSWPEADEQMQVHFDFSAADMPATRKRLCELGARVAEHQPHDPDLLTVIDRPRRASLLHRPRRRIGAYLLNDGSSTSGQDFELVGRRVAR
jgi:hypothetical protein